MIWRGQHRKETQMVDSPDMLIDEPRGFKTIVVSSRAIFFKIISLTQGAEDIG